MPVRPARPCAWPSCTVLIRGASYCPKHQPLADEQRAAQVKRTNQQYNARRDESDGFYKTERWKRLSLRYRKLHPLCENCEKHNRVTPSRMVDHKQPVKTHPELALDWENLQALCWPCHNIIGVRVGLLGSSETNESP